MDLAMSAPLEACIRAGYQDVCFVPNNRHQPGWAHPSKHVWRCRL